MKKIPALADIKADERIICACLAALITFGINAGSQLVIGAESDNIFVNFISKLSQSIYTSNIVDFTTWGCVFCMALYVRRHKHGRDIIGMIVALLLAFLYIWTFSYKDNTDIYVLHANFFQLFQTTVKTLGYAGLFYYMFEAIYLIYTKYECADKGGIFDLRFFAICFTLVFAVWIIYIVLGYPGSVAGDAIGQLNQFFKDEINAHHPPLSTMIMGMCVSIGLQFGNGAAGICLYLVLQAAICSIIISYSICVMQSLGISKRLCTLFLLILCSPIFGMYAQYFEKDMLYAIFTLMFGILSVRSLMFEDNSKSNGIFIFIVGILCCFLRNNGIYAIIPFYIACILMHKNKRTKGIYGVFAVGTVVIYIMINSVVFPMMGITPGHIREALSIPMQQSARYIRDYNYDVSEEEVAAMQLFFDDYESVAETYEPPCADAVKSMVIIEKKDIPGYFKNWFTMGMRHLGCYFDAFMCLNYGYLAPNEQNMEPSPSNDIVLEQLGDIGVDGHQNEVNLQILSSLSFINIVFPFLRYLTMPGFYTWVFIVLLAIQIKLRLNKALVLMIPSFMNLLVCLASPLCNGFRYELPLILSIPLMIAVTCRQINENKLTVSST